MSGFNGKWKRISATNVDALLKVAVGDDKGKYDELKTLLEKAEVFEEYHVTDNDVRRKVFVNGELKQDQTHKYAVEEDHNSLFGKAKLLVTKKSDKVIEAKETTADGRVAVATFAVDGNKLTLDFTMNNVTCTRVYEKC